MSGVTLPRRQLGGASITVTTLGFGGASIGWRDGPGAGADAVATLASVWAAGVRYFDTAPFYGFGRSERRVGSFLAQKPRDAFVLSTKVGRLVRDCGPIADPVVYDYSRDGARRSLEESLTRLGLDRVDIVLIHDIDKWTHGADQPRRFAEAMEGAYRTLSDLKAEGTVGAIGLGVNEWQVCQAFAERVPIDCILLAGRYTLLEQTAAETLLPFCLERGIGVIVGGPYNSGILATGPVRGALYDYQPAPEQVLERVRRIAGVCTAHGVSLPAAALAFPLRHPAVASVIPGVAGEAEAAAAFTPTAIPEELWTALAGEGLIREPA